MSAEVKAAAHTKGPWVIGWGKGVTGPTAPAVGGATCSERVANDDWIRLAESRQAGTPGPPSPKPTSLLVTVPDVQDGPNRSISSVVAIIPKRQNGEADANARLIACAPEMAALLDEIHAVRGTGRHVVIGRIPALLKKAGVI